MPTRQHTPAMCSVYEEAASKLRLMQQACGLRHGASSRRLKVPARLCFRHSSGKCLPPRSRTYVMFSVCKDAAIKLRLMEQACGLLDSARRRQTHGAYSSLPLALGWSVLAAPITHL